METTEKETLSPEPSKIEKKASDSALKSSKPKTRKSVRFNVPEPSPERILEPPPPPPPLPYEKPDWCGLPTKDYSFEVIKSGISLETIDIPIKDFITLGRLPICDISLEHPSTSRYHAIIQFKNNGEIYLYDLGSAHGTILNRRPIPPQSYTRIRIGDQLRFGESLRIYVLQGPGEDLEEVQNIEQQEETLYDYSAKKEIQDISSVTWGFAEDADEENELLEVPTAESSKRDENAYYYKDPRKALRNWFDNRGYNMEFEVEEQGPVHSRTFTARIQLPDVENAFGPVYGIGSSAKKRDAEKHAAIDACEKLDMLGILRGGHDKAAARKKRLRKLLGKSDDDDNDSYYDRTNQLERSKLRKLQTTASQKVETYESLTQQREELTIKIEELRCKISQVSLAGDSSSSISKDDDLEAYMDHLQNSISNDSKSTLELELQELLKKARRLDRLIQITKPHDIIQSDSKEILSGVESVSTTQADVILTASKDEMIDDHSAIKNNGLAKVSTIAVTASSPKTSLQDPSIKPTEVIVPRKRDLLGTMDPEKAKRARSMTPMTPQEYEDQQGRTSEHELEEENEEVSNWEPPKGQTGDGRTSLNDKYGY